MLQGAEFVWDRPGNYDLMPDGGFVIVRRTGGSAAERRLRVVLDWSRELERLLPRRGAA
ncbi:hypothetical protein D3C83_315210 [compost metagenome]